MNQIVKESIIAAARRLVDAVNTVDSVCEDLLRLAGGADVAVLEPPAPAEPPAAEISPAVSMKRGRRGAWVSKAKVEDKLKGKLKPEFTPKLAKSAAPVEQASREPDPQSRFGKILAVFRKRPDEKLKTDMVAKALKDPDQNLVTVAIAGLTKRKFLARVGRGLYQLASAVKPGQDPEEGILGVDQKAVDQVRDGVAESAAFEQGKDAFSSKGPREKCDDRNMYLGKQPALAAAFAKGWNEAANE